MNLYINCVSLQINVIIINMKKNDKNNISSEVNKTDNLLSAKELHEKMLGFSINYFMIDLKNDRKSFYAVKSEEMQEYWLCRSGKALNYIIDGELDKAWELIKEIPDNSPMYILKLGLTFVHPEVTWKEFIEILKFLKDKGLSLKSVALTAGRPYLLNGFNDFSRIGPILPKIKNQFIDFMKTVYEPQLCPYIYNLCLAEYYYQINNLIDAEMLVSSTIKKFDIDGERRIIFSSLYLQSKILLANGKTVNTEGFIKNMRKLAGEAGNAEFSYNIDAAEILFALYDGKLSFVYDWLETNAPDEFSDFNMLDLYRYFIKMKCYIAIKQYASVIALTEKLRPLLERGRRHIDLCHLDLMLALCLFASKKKELACEALSRALKIARKYQYLRLIADEGEPMLHLLVYYIKNKGENPFLMKIVEMTRNMAIRHPLYMKSVTEGGETFTPMEVDILLLLEQGKSKDEISEYFFITINTVKYHLKNIYSKLGANSPHLAVWNAKLRGII